jgi:choline dehydrogenase-like flavoprotein
VDHYFQQTIKVPNSPYPDNLDAPTANVKNLAPIPADPPADKGYLVQMGPFPFLSDYTRSLGGTTMHWLGTTPRMLPNDFRMKTEYGHGVDWPISYQDLRPYYEKAEREIGVSADVEEQDFPNMGEDYFSKGYQYPMKKIPQSYLDQKFGEGLEGMTVNLGGEEIKVALQSSPQGRNSTPNPKYRDEEGKPFVPVGMVGDPDAGQRCEGNSSCTPICPVQAKYNAMKTLYAIKQSKLEIRAQCVASKVNVDSGSGRVTGIEYKRYADADSPEHTVETARGKVYVLAAHAIENAKLMLASGIGNSSDQVGRNLMDHLCLLTWGLMPEDIGAYRGPGSTSGIPWFRDGTFRSEHCAFRVELGNWGWNWPTGAPNSDVENFVDKEGLFGTKLRTTLAARIPRQFRIAWEAEQLPHSDNHVTIDEKFKDRLGNYRPVIHYRLHDYTMKGIAASKIVSDAVNKQLGIEDHTHYDPKMPGFFEFDGSEYAVNGAGHVVVTHRMGSDKNDSVVDRNQRSWDHENLYLVGCGNMPTLGTSNPTLTASALSIWAAENILKDLA